jgi:hypothetical protein
VDEQPKAFAVVHTGQVVEQPGRDDRLLPRDSRLRLLLDSPKPILDRATQRVRAGQQPVLEVAAIHRSMGTVADPYSA